MTQLRFSPLDTLFFRDGRPYNQNESNAQVISQFPPFAPTLVGCARAAFARALGWPGKDWDTHVKAALGSGSDLGPVDYSGPYLYRDQAPLFPVPHSLVQDADGKMLRLVPGAARKCDLGEKVRLPVPTRRVDKVRPASGWLDSDGMTGFLAGKLPGRVYDDENLFDLERRIGNLRDPGSRNVRADHAVYSPAHVRLRKNVELLMLAEGLPEGQEPDNPAPLAGESRLCWITRTEEPVRLPEPPKLKTHNGVLRYLAVAITPVDVTEIGLPQPNAPYANLPGNLICACIGRPQKVGGWDGSGQARIGKGRPVALQSLLPAGSAFFVEANSGAVKQARGFHRKKIGARQAWGFGQIVIGTWGD